MRIWMAVPHPILQGCLQTSPQLVCLTCQSVQAVHVVLDALRELALRQAHVLHLLTDILQLLTLCCHGRQQRLDDVVCHAGTSEQLFHHVLSVRLEVLVLDKEAHAAQSSSSLEAWYAC